MMQSPDKAIRRATMVAKGLAKEIGPLPTGSRPAAPHPASLLPGVHVTGMGDEHTAIPDGYADGGDVTSNPHFSQWFGNSVTHDNGVPRTYYTGTSKDKDFTSFNVGRHGAWFTTDPHEASQYAENNDSQGHVWENGKFQRINTASRVIPAYLKAENPYTGERPEAISRAQNYKKAQSDWFDQLRAAGHDAWIPSSLIGNLAVMLRHPTQIKSAIGNNGDFDPKQKAIHRADGGPTPAWQRKEGQNPSGGLNSKARAIHKDDGGVVNPDDRQKNFNQWFGNSHVVDETGKPKVVYHGTAADVSQFEEGHSGSGVSNGRSFYFTDEPATAASYSAKDREAERLSGLVDKAHDRVIDTMLDPAAHKVARDEARAAHQAFHKRVDLMRSNAGPGEYGGEGGNIVPVHLSLRNPLIVDAQGRHYYDALGDNAPNPRKYKSDINQIVENAKARGHDGAIIKNIIDAGTMDAVDAAKRMGGNTTYVAFHPHQIKSAIGNQGTYNLNDNDITKAGGGDVEPTDETGFDAWHGTPHAFAPEPGAPLGRFRSDKIGTGEGAQAYGHGLYVGQEGTARGYKNTLRSRAADPEYMSGVRRALASLDQDKQEAYDDSLFRALTSDDPIELPKEPMSSDALPNIQAAARIFSAHDTNEPAIKVAGNIQAQFPHLRDEGSLLKHGPKRLAIADQVEKMRERTKGHLLHVRVRANPEHFLDWDKPLSEQTHVLDRIDHHIGDPEIVMQRLFADPSKATGKDLHDVFGGKHKPEAVATKLREMGIPGIRYLDANSRDPDTDQPTHNHVIFDPSIIDIKHRYARGGDVKPAGATTMPDDTVNRALQLTKQHAPVPAAVSLARNLMPGRR